MDEVVKVGAVMAMVLGVPAPGREDVVRMLRAEVEERRDLVPRMTELEERLDFAERLLAQRDVERLARGRDD